MANVIMKRIARPVPSPMANFSLVVSVVLLFACAGVVELGEVFWPWVPDNVREGTAEEVAEEVAEAPLFKAIVLVVRRADEVVGLVVLRPLQEYDPIAKTPARSSLSKAEQSISVAEDNLNVPLTTFN